VSELHNFDPQKIHFTGMAKLYDKSGKITLQHVFKAPVNFLAFERLLLRSQLKLIIYYLERLSGQTVSLGNVEEEGPLYAGFGRDHLHYDKPGYYINQLDKLQLLLCSRINTCEDKDILEVLVDSPDDPGIILFLKRIVTEGNYYESVAKKKAIEKSDYYEREELKGFSREWRGCSNRADMVIDAILTTAMLRWLSL
jgi:hypothetical protein